MLAITKARIIDGNGGDPIADGIVLIDDGRIAKVGPARSVALPKGADIIDAGGRTVLPGIVDCHIHATYRARDMRQHLLNTPTYNVLRSTVILRETLACGVTTARDMGGADAGFKAAIQDGAIAGPKLVISVGMISQTGGHGDSWVPAGLRVPKRTWLPDPVADGVEGVRRTVRHMLMAGADVIKICSTGGITSVTDSWDEPQFTVEELTTAVTEAAAKRKPVAVHAEGIDGIRTALAAGCHSLEHGWFIDEACVAWMLAKGTWWVPTLALVPLSLGKRKADTSWGAQQLGQEDTKETAIYQRMQAQIPLWREAVKRGVKVAFGTDQSHRLLVGENLVELAFMVDWLGMTPMQALVAATARAAECVQRSDVGTLEPGKAADILIVDGDPLADIRILENRARIPVVMQNGKAFRNTLG
ncbi:MAG: amidohydrolase family protein [Proteobacteria bacterium]|nr:amidohydrolase family protein [Pseudomonadota bacterium]